MPTKTPLRFVLIGAGLWLASAAASFAQEAPPDITLKLTLAQAVEILRLVDLQPVSISPPAAYWDLQINLKQTLEANPAALRAVLSARSAQR
jgi:hypothetical protein